MQQICKSQLIMYIKYVKTCFKFSTFVFHYKLSRDLTMNFRSYSVHVNHVWHRHNYV